MDFNDLNLRLGRLYSAINEQYDYAIEKHIKKELSVHKDGMHEFKITFGNNSETEVSNKVFNVIHAIAGLKDHLKNKLVSAGGNKQDVEVLIDNSEALSLIMDLDNKDKHGDPLTRTNRSSKNPKLQNLGQGLTVDKGSGEFSIAFEGFTDKIAEKKGNFKVTVVGDVVDEKGQRIMSLQELFNRAMDDLENFIKDRRLGDVQQRT